MIITSWTKSGFLYQTILRYWIPLILFCTSLVLFMSAASSKVRNDPNITNTILFVIYGCIHLVLLALCYVERIGGMERIKLVSDEINFIGMFISAVVMKDLTICSILVLTYWLPLATYGAINLYIPSISEIRVNDPIDDNNRNASKLLFYLSNAIATHESKVLTECRITHILELTDGKSRNNLSKLPSHIILSQRMVSDTIGDNSANDLFTIANQSIEFIRGCQDKKDGVLLIHCNDGISLSTKFALYYLVKEKYVSTVYEAYRLIQKSRPVVSVSLNDLKELEQGLTKTK